MNESSIAHRMAAMTIITCELLYGLCAPPCGSFVQMTECESESAEAAGLGIISLIRRVTNVDSCVGDARKIKNKKSQSLTHCLSFSARYLDGHHLGKETRETKHRRSIKGQVCLLFWNVFTFR